jgi:hypothetical protein
VGFWIDENLTPALVRVAHARGYEATTNRDRGKLRLPDERMYIEVRDGDWALVTNNRQDFERLIEQTQLHAGLIVLPLRRRDDQVTTFETTIEYIEASARSAGDAPADWLVNLSLRSMSRRASARPTRYPTQTCQPAAARRWLSPRRRPVR